MEKKGDDVMIDYTYEAKVLFNERAYDEAFAFAEKADKSDKYIQYILGTCYRNGYGTEKNLDLAVDYFQKSARQRMEWACFRLGIMYYNAEGIARDYDKAFYWIKKAAARGHAEAQRCLAVCYRDGIGVEKNNEEALFEYLIGQYASYPSSINKQTSIDERF